MMTKTRLMIVFSILVVTSGCSLFSTNVGDEIIYAPTEVGTPVGDKVAKDIGTTGGTISSPDGRLTLTVPQNALAETITFTIQPITNNVQTGIGAAYRLEPDGGTFTTPLELSMRYDERDLEGTAVEALAIAFQDREGKWHVLDPSKLDDANKSIKFSITHFTDFSFLAKFRLEPSKATLRVGETMQIKLIGCEEPITVLWVPIKTSEKICVMNRLQRQMEWYADVGTITGDINPAIYTAPPRKPRPNVATVSFPYKISRDRDRERIDPVLPNHEFSPERRGMFTAKITIVDWGYRVSGQGGGLTYSGVICSLESPFTVYGSAYNYNFKFTPSSESNGTWAVETSIDVGRLKGGGAYTIENLDSDKPRIKVMGNVNVTVPYAERTGGGTHYFDLTPLDTDECSGR